MSPPVVSQQVVSQPVASPSWWRNALVYQIYVRSFCDSNGDGIGDLDGITQRLGHIAGLGANAIWLNPCFPSPQRDHGYDISNYFDIEPAYGDLAAFDRLVAAAHGKGLKVLLDVVPNHCSTEHPLFAEAIAGGPGCDGRKMFWFQPGKGPDGALPPNNWKAIFGGSAWTRVTEPDGRPGEWYLGVFTSHQPDWNFRDKRVEAHFVSMLKFWFDRGVDGFRADAVIYLGKEDGLPDAEADEVDSPINPKFTYVSWQHEVWRSWRKLVNDYQTAHGRDLLLVAEAFSPNRPDIMLQFTNPDEFHQSFAFDLMLARWNASAIRETIAKTLDTLAPAGILPAWTLNNHDTQRSATRFGRADITELGGFHNGAFRISDAPIDEALGQRRCRAAVALLLGLPGCVYLYAGEELGLPEVLEIDAADREDPVFFNSDGALLGRDGCRVPMPWTVSESCSFGFSGEDPVVAGTAAPWLPQPGWWGEWSVERQSGDSSSVLELYRRLGQLRSEIPEFNKDAPSGQLWGHPDGEVLKWLDLGEYLVALSRGDVVVVCNCGLEPAELPSYLVEADLLISSLPGEAVTGPTIPGNTTLWLRLRPS